MLNSDIFTHFTLFESNFVNITLDSYGWIKTTNLKVLLFIVASSTILIEHEIFDPKKETTKVTVVMNFKSLELVRRKNLV